jgi:glutathione S-transferase
VCHSIFEAAQEICGANAIVNVFKGDAFEAKKADFFASTLPPKLAGLKKYLEASGGPFTTGHVPRYCDFAVYHQFDLCRLLEPSVFDDAPAAGAFMAAVEALPGVAEYLAGRPDCVGISTNPSLQEKL